jgi:hypothetical protein
MPETNLSSSSPFQIDALRVAYHAVVDSVEPMGLSAAELTAVFSHHLSAECLQCGLQVSGKELSQLALASPETPPSEPRLARLHQGYCARKDCDSYYYRFVFQEHPKVDWTIAASAVARTPAPAPAATPSPAAKPDRFWFLQDPRLRRVALGIGILLVLLVIRHCASGGRLPFVHRTPKYTVDPASVSEAPLSQPPTNRVADP